MMPATYKGRASEALEGERHYVKDRQLTSEIKESFPNPIDIDVLAAFVSKNLSVNKLAGCMTEFGIPSESVTDKDKFCRALAIQFNLFVTTEGDDVPNSVGQVYQTLLNGREITQEDLRGPRYKGDDVYVDNRKKSHNADCYETIHHEWNLQNRGSQEWQRRALVLVNQAEIHPRPVRTIIPIPDTRPGESADIATDIDARGFEGDFECKWQMRDADGENCFPNKRWEFNIHIRVTFNATSGGEKRG